MNEPIFIARQDTLEQEILPAQWLSHYKLFGEESYTFQDKEIWKKLCMSSAAANDRDMHAEALEEMLTTFSAEHTGKWMLLVYGMDAAELNGLATMAAVAGNGTAMAAVAGNALLMHAIINSETAMHAITNSETAMRAIANSQTAMQRVANSATAMDAISGRKIARDAVQASPYYNSYIKENSMAIAKLAVGFANLASAGYSGMAGVAADGDRYERSRCELCGKKCDFGFALLRCKNQGERHGDCQTGGWLCEPRICRLFRLRRNGRQIRQP